MQLQKVMVIKHIMLTHYLGIAVNTNPGVIES